MFFRVLRLWLQGEAYPDVISTTDSSSLLISWISAATSSSEEDMITVLRFATVCFFGGLDSPEATDEELEEATDLRVMFK